MSNTSNVGAPSDQTNVTPNDGNQVATPLQQRGADELTDIISTSDPGKTAAPATVPSKSADDRRGAEGAESGKTSGGGITPTPLHGGTVPAKPAPSAGGTIDPGLIEQIVNASVRGVTSAQQQTAAGGQAAQQKEMSPEEFNAKYGLRTVDEATVARLLDTDPKKAAAAFNELLLSNTRAAVLMAKDLFEAQLTRARGEYEPHVKAWQQFQAEQAEVQAQNKFFKTYPDLAEERELVNAVKDAFLLKVNSGQLKFASQDEAFKALADGCHKWLARMNKPTGAPSNGSGQSTQQSAGSPRQMTAASAAGQSGTSRSAGKSDEEKIFGGDWV